MYCKKCGNEISDEAVICPKCGCATDNYGGKMKKTSRLTAYEPANGVLLFLTFIIPIIGLILGIIDISKGKTTSGKLYLKSWGWNLVLWIINIWAKAIYASVPSWDEPPVFGKVLYFIFFVLCVISIITVICWFRKDKLEYNRQSYIERDKSSH